MNTWYSYLVHVIQQFKNYLKYYKCWKDRDVNVQLKYSLTLFIFLLSTSLFEYYHLYYNKNKWVSDHSVEIMWIVFCVGWVKYPYQKQWTCPSQMINKNLFLFLCRTTINWMLILMVYVYNFKEFTGETAIS